MNAGKLGLLSVGLTLSLAACNLLGGAGPAISNFKATPSTIMAGGSSTLSWTVDPSATKVSISNSVGDVTNRTSVTVQPTTTTNYTLTATSPEGTKTATTTVTVSGGNDGGTGSGGTGGGNPDSAPTGTFGVAATATGTFQNDTGDAGNITSDSDPRIIDVAPGATFYAQVDYTDPDGISSIDVFLANSTPAGLRKALPSGGFTAGEPTGCDLSTNPVQVTCVYPITVDPTVVDISQLQDSGSEFAYVFRALVADSLGNSSLGQERGYVNIVP